MIASVGLYISVSATGNAEDLTVDAHLSACYNDGSSDVCDGDASSMLTTLGFPFKLLEFVDLSFNQCPRSAATSWLSQLASKANVDETVMIAAAGAFALILLVVVIVVTRCRKTAKPPTTSTSEIAIEGNLDFDGTQTQTTHTKQAQVHRTAIGGPTAASDVESGVCAAARAVEIPPAVSVELSRRSSLDDSTSPRRLAAHL
jgi:hypothetical protein